MRKAYLLILDREGTDTVKLHQFIKYWPSVNNWWHYLQSCYILISTKEANELSEEIRKELPNQRFLLVEANLANSNGWLPQKAWDWIRNNS